MFKKILIANRGEIAIRVLRACRDMGVQSVAVYSEADHNSLHVALADEAYEIGPAPSSLSYLKVENILKVAIDTGADAVHPGYGFLSENTELAKALEENNIAFIGPSIEHIKNMGDKLSAIEIMRANGVPTVPGSQGAVEDLETAKEISIQIGYPVMIKASAGGGGKGMRLVHSEKELESSFRSAQSEGKNYFNNSTVYIEKCILNPKHIEIQIFGDKHGNVVHLYERECSIQRRHQKLIEETPSPSVPQEIREKMGHFSVKAAKAMNYLGAGTFEYIYDYTSKDFYFMEMNTRLQVEHGITEMVTGVDLVKEQIKVAFGLPLSFKQDDIKPRGHSIEARICAEDPTNFMPSPGVIRRCRHPQGPFVRVDSCAFSGYEVPIYYDPMIAKVIVWAPTRQEAIANLKRALIEFTLTGIKSNIVLHKSIIDHAKFKDGSYTTNFCETDLVVSEPDLFRFVDDKVFLISAAIQAYRDRKSQDVSKHNLASRWKTKGRQDMLR